MREPYKYILEKGSKKFTCPNCLKKTFVRYIDVETGNYLPEQYGRCDREAKCGYHLSPYANGYNLEHQLYNRREFKSKNNKTIPKPEPDPVFFDFDTFKQTLSHERYEHNTFLQNLIFNVQFPFEVDDISKVVQLYRLGTVMHGYRKGAVTFPFIDLNDNVRAIQVKQFNEQNHTTGTDFLHSIIEKHYSQINKSVPEWLTAYKQQDKRITCLFGEHLLNRFRGNPVALVEAPKTAVYGTLYLGYPTKPESLIWLAVYNKSSFSFEKLKVLQGRFVYVFPDLSTNRQTFNEWETKAKEYERWLPGTRFIFSDFLEQHAAETDKKAGSDIADYLIKQDWKLFRKANANPSQSEHEPVKSEASAGSEVPKRNIISHSDNTKQVNEVFKWDTQIIELENYFTAIELPTQPVKLNDHSIIMDCSVFINTHLEALRIYNGNSTFLPFLNRLSELKNLLNSGTKKYVV